jgi:hypothetical protein
MSLIGTPHAALLLQPIDVVVDILQTRLALRIHIAAAMLMAHEIDPNDGPGVGRWCAHCEGPVTRWHSQQRWRDGASDFMRDARRCRSVHHNRRVGTAISCIAE